jgi:hypothetical protein
LYTVLTPPNATTSLTVLPAPDLGAGLEGQRNDVTNRPRQHSSRPE